MSECPDFVVSSSLFPQTAANTTAGGTDNRRQNLDIQFLGCDYITGADTVRIRGKAAAQNTKSFMVIYYTTVLYCSQSAI